MSEREWTILVLGLFIGTNAGFILAAAMAAAKERDRAVARSLHTVRTLRREDDLERAYRLNADAIDHEQATYYGEKLHEA